MSQPSARGGLLIIFLVALVVRGIFFFQVLDHPEVVEQPDSNGYISLANGLLQYGRLCHMDSPGVVHVARMPGYPLFLGAILWFFHGSLLAAVMIQIIIDSLSCLLIYYLGELIREGAGLLSGILACVNIGMITYSQFILTDSLFLFFFIAQLILIFRFMGEPTWKLAVPLGILMGLTVYVRSVTLYFPLLILLFLFIYFTLGKRFSIVKAAGRLLVVVVIFLLVLSPWYMRNYGHYGKVQLMSQSGRHLLKYVLPYFWQYSKGIPFMDGMERAEKAFSEMVEREGIDIAKIDPFRHSDLQVDLAVDFIGQEPLSAILKAWAFGITKNLFSPAIIDLSYLLNIERPHFFYTKGNTFLERSWNFIKNMKGVFAVVVTGSLAVMFLTRSLQMWGLLHLIRQRFWPASCLLLTIAYFLLVSGPVGYAKYRLPFEPLLIVLLAIGLRNTYGRLRVMVHREGT